MNRLVNAWVIYQFLKLLVTPFEKTKAFELGIIDKDGNYLKKQKDLQTPQEKLASNIFTRLVWKMKKLLGKVPGGKSKIASIVTALWFIKEEAEKIGADPQIIDEVFNEYMMRTHNVDFEKELINEQFSQLISDK